MATETDIPDSIYSKQKREMQDNELASESLDEKVTEPPSNRLKQLESRPDQPLESSNDVGETGIKQVEAQTEAGRENDIAKGAAATIEGESFLQSHSAEETSSIQEAYEDTTTLDQGKRRMPEIEPLKEGKSGVDERIEVAASKETSADKHPPSSGDNMKEVKNEVEEVITSEKVVEATFAQTKGSLVHSIGLQKVTDMDSEEVKDTDFSNPTPTESQAKKNEGKKDEEEAIEITDSGKEKTGSSSVNAACEKTGSVKAGSEEDGEPPENSSIKLNREIILTSSEDEVQKEDERDLLAEKNQGSADAASEDIKERATSHVEMATNAQGSFGDPIEILNAETEEKAITEKESPVKASEEYEKNEIIEHKGEPKQEESANAAVFCSSEIEQEVEANSKQDEADEVNKKEEVKSSETELMVQEFDATYHMEDTETEHLKDEMKESDTQDVIESSEGTELVESEEFTASTSKPKVPQNVAEDGVFEKSEPSVTRNLEETSLKEIKEDEKMESINSDLSSEKTGLTHVGAYETGAIDVNSTAKLEDCNMDENKNNQIPETEKFEANIAGKETDQAASGGTEKASLGNKDEATSEIPQSHRPDEILNDSSSQLLESHIPVTAEMNEATEGNLQGVEIPYDKEGSPIATEIEYEKLQKIGVQSIDPETRMQMGNVTEEFDKKEDSYLTPEQKEKSIEASSGNIKTNEEIDCSETSESKMQQLEKGLKADASNSKYEDTETGISFTTAREESSITSIQKDKSNTIFSGTKKSMEDGSDTVKNMNLEAVGKKTSAEPEKITEQDFRESEIEANNEMEAKIEAEHPANKIADRSEMIDEVVLSEEMSEELRQPKEQKFKEKIDTKELQMQSLSNDALKKSETEYDKVVMESLDEKVVELPCNTVKQPESRPNQSVETSCSVGGTGVRQGETDIDIERDNAVTEGDNAAIDGETFIQSPSVSEITTDESSSTKKGTKGTTTQNDAETKTKEIEPLKEGKPKDDYHIEVLESQNASTDEHSPTTRDQMKEPQNEAEGEVVESKNSTGVVESENSGEATFAQIEASSVHSFGLTKGTDIDTEEVNETCNKEESMGDSPNTKTSSSGKDLQGRDYHNHSKEPEFSKTLEGIESNTEEKRSTDEIEEKVKQPMLPHASSPDICISTQIESQNEGTENEEKKNEKVTENDDDGNENSGDPSVDAVCEYVDSEEARTEEHRTLSDGSAVELNEKALIISNEDEVQEKEQELNLLPEKEQGEGGIKESQDAASQDIKETTTSQHATTLGYIEEQRIIESPEEIHKGEIVDKAINVQDIIDEKGPVKDEASEDIKETATSQHATTIANFIEQRIIGNSKEILEGEIEDEAMDVQDIVEKSPVKDAACDDIKEAATSQHAIAVTDIEEQKLIANPEEILKGEVENKAINAQDIDEKPVKASEEYKNDENRGEQKPVKSLNEPVLVSSEMEHEVLGNSKEDETDAAKITEEASEEYKNDEDKKPGESVNEPVHVSSEMEQEVLGNSKKDETDTETEEASKEHENDENKEEQRPGENVNEPVHVSSEIKQEVWSSKEDETDAVKKTEEASEEHENDENKEEQKPGENVNEPVHVSSEMKQEVLGRSKEDETDAVKKTEEASEEHENDENKEEQKPGENINEPVNVSSQMEQEVLGSSKEDETDAVKKTEEASEEYENDENKEEQKPGENIKEPVHVSSEMEQEVLGSSKEDETDAVKKTEVASEEYENDENREEQKPGENVNEPVNVSSEILQEVLGSSEGDETDAVKKTEEVKNSEAEFMDQDFDIKRPMEESENENIKEELNPKDYETQDDKGLSEGTTSKESENLLSSSKPKVPQNVAEEEILGKPEPTFIGIPEETNSKEDDKVQSINSDLSFENTGTEHGACETDSVDVSTTVKEDPKSDDNENIQIPKTEKIEVNKPGDERKCEALAGNQIILPENKDQATGEIPQSHISEQTIKESSAPLSGLHIPEPTKVNEAKEGTLQDFEMLYDKAGSPIATEAEYVKLQKIGDQSMDQETHTHIGIITEEVNKEEHLSSIPEQEKSMDVSSGNVRINEETGSSDTGELQMQEAGMGLEVEASSNKAAKEKPTVVLGTTANELQGDISGISSDESLPVCQILMDIGNVMHSSSIEPSTEDTSNIEKSKAESEKLPLESVFDEVRPKSEDSKVKEEHLPSARAEYTNEDNLHKENETTANDISNEEKIEETTDIEQAAEHPSTVYDNAVLVAKELGGSSGKENITGKNRSINVPCQDSVTDETINGSCPQETEEDNVKHASTNSDETKLGDTKVDAKDMTEENFEPCKELRPASESMSEYQLNETPLQQEISDVDNEKNKIEGQALESHFERISEKDSAEVKRVMDENVTLENQNKSAQDHSETIKDVILTEEIERVPVEIQKERIADEDICVREPQKISASNQKEIANEGSYLYPTPSENSEVTEVRADARIKDLQAAGNFYGGKASSTVTGSRTGMIEDTEKHVGIVKDIKDYGKNETPKEERIPFIGETFTLDPQEKFPDKESTDSPDQDSMKLRQPVVQRIQEPTEEGVVDSSNANNKTEGLLITHSADRECVPEEVLEKRKEASGLEFHTDEKNTITSESQIQEEIQKTEMTEEHQDAAKETIEIIAEPEGKEAHEDSIRLGEPSEELEGVDTKEDMEVKGSGERKAMGKSYQDGVGEVTVTESPKHEKEEQESPIEDQTHEKEDATATGKSYQDGIAEAPIEVQTHEKEDATATGKSYQDGVAEVTVTESPKHEKVEQEALIENPMSIEPHEETKPAMADDQTSEPSSDANKIKIDNSSENKKDQNPEFTEEEKNFSEVQREIDEEGRRKIPAYNKETQYAHEMVKDVIMTEEVVLEVEKAEESRVIKDTINEERWVKDQLTSATDEKVCQSAGYEATEDLELAADNQDLKAETFTDTNVSDKDMKQNIEKTANITTSELEWLEKMVTEENTERAEAREAKEILKKPHANEIGTAKSGTSDSISESKERNIQEVGGGESKDHVSMEESEEKIIEVPKTESEGAQVITGGEEVGASSTEKNQGAPCEMLPEKKDPVIITSSETEDEGKTKDETLVSMSMEETSARGAEELTWLSKEKTEELQVLTASSEIDEGKKSEIPDKMLKKESEAAQTQEHASEGKSVDSPSEEGIREQGTITRGCSQEPSEEKSLLSQKFEDSFIQLSADKETLQSEVSINFEETRIKEIDEHDKVLDSTNQGEGQSADAVRNAKFSETKQQHLNKKEAILESMNQENQNKQIKEADENVRGEVSNDKEPKPTTVHMEATNKSDTFIMSADEEENRNKLSEDESKKQDSQEYPEEQTCQELEVAKHPFHTDEADPIEDIQQEKMAEGNILEEETKERTNLVDTSVKVDLEKEGDETNCEGTSTETVTPMAEFNKDEVEFIHNDMDARAVDNYALTKNHEVQTANLKVPSVVDAIVEEAGHEKDSNNGTAEVYEADLVKEDVHRESTGSISKSSEEVGAKEQVTSPPIEYSSIEAKKIGEGIEHENPQNSISDKQKEEEAKITRKEECNENEEELQADEPLNLPERSVGYDAAVSHGAEDTEDLKISEKYGMVDLMEVGEISKEMQNPISEEPHQSESMKIGSIDVIQGQGEPTAKSLDAEAESLKAVKTSNVEPQHSSVVFEEAEKLGDECKDKKEKSETTESAKISLADILQESTKGNSQVSSNLVEERTVKLKKDHKQVVTEETSDCEGNMDDEKEEEEDNDDDPKVDSCSDAPVLVDASKDMEVKVHKKSHNILSGVGSRVKHSIAKVKKAITGKSSHPKPLSPKQRDEVIN